MSDKIRLSEIFKSLVDGVKMNDFSKNILRKYLDKVIPDSDKFAIDNLALVNRVNHAIYQLGDAKSVTFLIDGDVFTVTFDNGVIIIRAMPDDSISEYLSVENLATNELMIFEKDRAIHYLRIPENTPIPYYMEGLCTEEHPTRYLDTSYGTTIPYYVEVEKGGEV